MAAASQQLQHPRNPDNDPSVATLDLSTEHREARRELLGDAYFPNWQHDDAGRADLENPDEMQRKDPLGTQIWKLYSRTKTQLPNQERMENLTWRMMAMNLKRREQAARFVTYPAFPICTLYLPTLCPRLSPLPFN